MVRSAVIIMWTAIVILAGTGMAAGSVPTDKVINPHWTRAYCLECHLEEGKAQLRFDGDPVKLCHRCHEAEFVATDIHPVNVTPGPEMLRKMPPQWPLQSEKVTCLTCHDALPQMKKDFYAQSANPAFLRGAPHEQLSDFCFSCHDQNRFQKTNPHLQLDNEGNPIEGKCLFCHQVLPDPDRVQGADGVTFLNSRSDMCVSCHEQKQGGHPAEADHLKIMPESAMAAFENQISRLGVDLPLFGGRVSCGTCHNPHQPGVIKRQAAIAGAGEAQFLRLKAGRELCVPCHKDMAISGKRFAGRAPVDLMKRAPAVMLNHEPWEKQACKSCHVFSSQKRGRPEAVHLCFREGCHKTEILEKEFVHERTVTENCYFCHESHSAGYAGLLRSNEERLCYTCHPGISLGKNEDRDASIGKEAHAKLVFYSEQIGIPPEDACRFCHNAEHRTQISRIKTGACADCHIYASELSAKKRAAADDVHRSAKKKPCSECHDPHASAHRWQLKKSPENYKPQP